MNGMVAGGGGGRTNAKMDAAGVREMKRLYPVLW